MTSASKTRWAWISGTFFGIGLLGKGGGTWASIVTVGIWWVVSQALGQSALTMAVLLAAVVATLIGVAASNILILETGKKDPSEVVLDEVAGQLITLIAAPVPGDWKYVLASLILFRVFDIFKPPPVRQLERIAGGWGVMLDDVAAGGMALAVLQVFHFARVV